MALICVKNVALSLFICIAFVMLGTQCYESDEHIPTRMSQGGGTMTFLYCYSCGYRKAFEDYVNIISEKYPHITVTGANYDPPGWNMYLSKIVFAIKIMFIVVIVSSYDLFGALGQQTPGWWRHLLENKIYACMMIFFVGNMLEGQLVASGAFEISLNGMPIWSKLDTGRIPAPQELFQIIESHMNLGEKLHENPDFVK